MKFTLDKSIEVWYYTLAVRERACEKRERKKKFEKT